MAASAASAAVASGTVIATLFPLAGNEVVGGGIEKLLQFASDLQWFHR